MDPLLLVGIAAGAIAILLFTVIKLKWPAFVALLVVAVLTALAGGIPVQDVVPLLIEGMGGTLGSVALLVGLGAMLGGIIERTGGAEVIAHAAAEALGEKRLAQALLIASGLVAIPIFFDVAFIILVPIIFAFAKAAGHRGPVAIGMPVAVFMVFIHNTVPPHPGIVGSTTLLGEDLMGLVTLSGIVLAIPMCLLVHLVGKRVTSRVFALSPEIEEKYAGTGAAELGSAGHGRRAAVGGNDGAAVDGASGSSHVAAASPLALAPADARTGNDFTGGGSTAVSPADGELAGRRPSAGLVIG